MMKIKINLVDFQNKRKYENCLFGKKTFSFKNYLVFLRAF